jgi:protein O-mannosyl-transferase
VPRLANVVWTVVAILFGTLAAVLAYSPSQKGPFVFDDLYLPFAYPDAADRTLSSWLMGVRPALMFTYWLNYRIAGLSPLSYHAVNLGLHLLCTCLVFLFVRQIIAWDGQPKTTPIALISAAIFLLHPVQTEAVAYVAGRSDTLSAAFSYGALVLFICGNRVNLSWRRSAGVVLLFFLACCSKEDAVILPVALVITDLYWGGLKTFRHHKHLYGVLLASILVVTVFVARSVLPSSQSAGFGLSDLNWYQYAFSECRAIWVYLRLFFMPVNQNADYDFPISRTILQHGAAFGLLGIIILAMIAIRFRKRYRVASYGLALFLVLILPTSSVIPILDPVAERRVYLPSIGLVLLVAGLVRLLPHRKLVMAGIVFLILPAIGVMSFRRNEVWSSPIALWEDTVAESPGKYRPRFQLAYALYQSGKCPEATKEYNEAAEIGPRDYRLLFDSALAEDCAGKTDVAISKLNEAAALQPTAQVYAQIGFIYAREAKSSEALHFFQQAEVIDSNFEMTYVYRGILYARSGDLSNANRDFRKALALNPRDKTAAAAIRYLNGAAGGTPAGPH